MNQVKREIVSFGIFALFCAATLISYFAIAANSGKAAYAESPICAYTVVIDAGHGGIDQGVQGVKTSTPESEINLSIANKLKECFENCAINVVMTRTSSSGLYGTISPGFKKRDMQKRAEIIKENHPDLFISIHQNNYSSPSRRGAQVFYRADSDCGKEFALKVQAKLNTMEESVRSCAALAGDYYVLNVSECAAIIVECGFLSNEEDEKLLVNADYQQKLAKTIMNGAMDYITSIS